MSRHGGEEVRYLFNMRDNLRKTFNNLAFLHFNFYSRFVSLFYVQWPTVLLLTFAVVPFFILYDPYFVTSALLPRFQLSNSKNL